MWKQHPNISQNSLCVSTQRWRHYLVTLLAAIRLWSVLLKKHNDHFIKLVSVSLTRSWTQAALHRLEHCPTVPNKLTLIAQSLVYTLTSTIFTEIYHSYFYSLWYKPPNIASLLPLTWPRWGRGHRWLLNDDPQWFTFIHEKKPTVLQLQYMGQDLIPKLRTTVWVLKVSSLIPAQLKITARWSQQNHKSNKKQRHNPESTPPVPLANQPVLRKLVGCVKVQCQWADTSPHWKWINSQPTMWTHLQHWDATKS